MLNNLQRGGFVYQSLHTIVSRGGLFVAAFLTGILTARLLKPEGKGVLALFQVLPAMVISFGELGIRQSTAWLIGRKQYEDADIQAGMMALFYASGAAGFLLVLLGYWALDLYAFGTLPALVFAVVVPVTLLQRYATGLLLGRKQIEKMNYSHLLIKFASLTFLVLFVAWLGWGVPGAGLAFLAGQLCATVLVLVWIGNGASLKSRWRGPIPGLLLSKGVWFAAAVFVLTLNYRADVLILGHLKGPVSVGLYSVGVALCELLWEVPLSIGVVLFSRSLNWTGEQARDSIDRLYTMTRLLLPAVVLAALAVVGGAALFVPLLYGEAFRPSIQAILLLVPGTIPLTLFLFLHFFAAGQGNPNLALKAFVPGLALNVALNFLLVPSLDFRGSALASTISYTSSVVFYIYLFTRQYGGTFGRVLLLRRADLAYLRGLIRPVPAAGA